MHTMNFLKCGLRKGTQTRNMICFNNDLIFSVRVRVMDNAIMNINRINSVMVSAPRTLIHNDCNPRNICLRKLSTEQLDGESARMCLYDWELATLDVPQRDLAEFLTFTLLPTSTTATRMELMNYYRYHLEQSSGIEYPMDRYNCTSYKD